MLRRTTFWIDLTGALLLAVLCATPILMSTVMDRGFEVAKLSLAEPFALLALASILLACGWRWVSEGSVETKAASACLLAFLAVAGVSTVMSEHRSVALFGGYARRDGLLAWTAYAALFFALLGWSKGQATAKLAELIDFLLLASVIPSVYAIQQRLGLDFFHVANRDLTRPNGTLGNPVFLGAYFAILLPIASARVWRARQHRAELAVWLSVALLQATGLLLTQSRGPLLACIAGSAMLAAFGAGFWRSRRTLFTLVALLFTVGAGVAALNMRGPVQQWAQDVPVVGRLVYNLEPETGAALSLGTRSTAARLGIWQAATETFREAPAVSKWIGFGPESAYVQYFSHLPDTVMQVDGYFQSDSYDRFHADTLDIGLNFGILGWLVYYGFFGAVFLAAARALFGLNGKAVYSLFIALPLIGGLATAALANVAGFPATIAPAAGLGMGATWFLCFLGYSWRATVKGLPEAVRLRPELWILLAGLTSSLLVFWLDAQVNIPVLTTRVLSLSVAALILTIASTMRAQSPAEPAPSAGVSPWGVAVTAIAAYASLLPAVVFDASRRIQETERWWLCCIPIISFMLLGVWYAFVRRTISNDGGKGSRGWILKAVGFPALYALCHWALMARIGPEIESQHLPQLAMLVSTGTGYILVSCFVLTWAEHRKTVANDRMIIPQSNLAAAMPAFALALFAATVAWSAIKADVGSTVALWATSGQREVSDKVLSEAIKAMPHERQYQRQRTFAFLGFAMEDIKRFGASAETFPQIKHSLDIAEKQARGSMLQFPKDPWIVLALANALQIRALPIIRPLAVAEGSHAALEADEMFARAYELFPNQPLLLRNWAQLRFYGGDHWGAYRLLDRMESVIPNEVDPYYERIMLARQIGDSSAVRETLARAGTNLDQLNMTRLTAVANLQQP